MNIQIKNQLEIPVINLSDFRTESGDDPIFISTQVKIELDGFSAVSSVSIELSDYNKLLSDLNALYRATNVTFYFQDIDGRLVLKFERSKTGHISVSGDLRNIQHTSGIEFKFQIGEEQIPDLITQCEIMVNKFNLK